MKLTRRELAGMIVAVPLAAGQAPGAAAAESPEQLLNAAAEDNRKSAAAISKPELPVETEPAFAFKAQ